MVRLVCLAVLVFALSLPAFANTATLTITDDDPFIIGFNIYKSTMSGVYDFTKPLANVAFNPGGPTTYQDTIPNDRNYYYVVRSVGTTGLESANSNEVIGNPLPPKAPGVNIGVVPSTAALIVNNQVVAQAPVGSPMSYSIFFQGKPQTVGITVTYQ